MAREIRLQDICAGNTDIAFTAEFDELSGVQTPLKITWVNHPYVLNTITKPTTIQTLVEDLIRRGEQHRYSCRKTQRYEISIEFLE